MPSDNYYRKINRNIKARLRQEKAEARAQERAVKAESKRLRKEQSEALRRMKAQGIPKKDEKAFFKTREKRLKKLGLKSERIKTPKSKKSSISKTDSPVKFIKASGNIIAEAEYKAKKFTHDVIHAPIKKLPSLGISTSMFKSHQPSGKHYTIKGNPEEQGFRALR